MANRLITTLFLCLASPAFAGQLLPPKYDHPYPGKMEKHLVPYGFAAKKCRSLGAEVSTMVEGRHLYGCQFFDGDTCVIVYSYDPSGKDRKMMSNVYRHERGHCNGWVHE